MHTLTIPVKPFVSKYIYSRYGQQLWEINKADRIGKMIYSLLDRMPLLYSKSKLNYPSSLTIGICQDYAARKGLYLSNESIREFNDFIQSEIVEAVAMYEFNVKHKVGLKKYRELYVVHNRKKAGKVHIVQDPDLYQYMEQKEIIYDILKIYDITEDDLPHETIRKACQRLKLPLLSA